MTLVWFSVYPAKASKGYYFEKVELKTGLEFVAFFSVKTTLPQNPVDVHDVANVQHILFFLFHIKLFSYY